MAGPDLSNYVEVSERIRRFAEKYPEGSLQGEHEFVEVNGSPWVVYRALAYRAPDDQRPGVGTAWEPIPGRTPYTKFSELMNAETSAWGRAIAALGLDVGPIASREEVQNRRGEPDVDENGELVKISEGQQRLVKARAKSRNIDYDTRDRIIAMVAGVKSVEEIARQDLDMVLAKFDAFSKNPTSALERLAQWEAEAQPMFGMDESGAPL
jgi:hypothetical protein